MRIKLLIYLCFFICTFLCCNSRQKEYKTVEELEIALSKTPDTLIDYPYNYGMWLTLKTTDQKKVAAVIGLEDYKPVNWKYGFKYAKNNNRNESCIFISPVINNNWLVLSGYNLPHPSTQDVVGFLNTLSLEFGEVHYYLYHEKIRCIVWSKNGVIERFVWYNDVREIMEKGDITKAEQLTNMESLSITYNLDEALTKEFSKNPTRFEEKYKYLNYAVETVGDTEVYVADTIPWPGKYYVEKIAEQWSLNPKQMEKKGYNSQGLGLFGRTRFKY
ncbi:hypothetical protein [uncultured Psychroserpens sp.]|uniref:hypothetical protein n=1 Tax=uncultured Psychroserpens sp. TaxID=255436 RepID=UPI002613B2D5|nr:hypothetical protein [uncultured Psychroserpens sp.]